MAHDRNGTARQRNLPLLNALDQAGITQGELAKRASVSINTLSMIMRRRTMPKTATAERIAAALNVPLAMLFPETWGKDENGSVEVNQTAQVCAR